VLSERAQQGEGIVDKPVDQSGPGDGVVPGDERLACGLVIVGAEGDPGRPRDGPAHPADGGDQLGDCVLGGHSIVEQCRAEGPTRPSLQHPGGVDDDADGVEDAFGMFRPAQPGTPISEHRVVETLVVKGQAAGHLPAGPVAQCPGRVPVREPLEGLEDHD